MHVYQLKFCDQAIYVQCCYFLYKQLIVSKQCNSQYNIPIILTKSTPMVDMNVSEKV